MLLVVDNGSVHTPNLTRFLTSHQIPFDVYTGGDYADYDSYILSGRKRNDKSQNSLNSKIIQHAISAKKNLLGICYGAEILVLTVGGTIKKISPKKGTETVSITKDNSLCNGKLEVFESHSYEIARIPNRIYNIGESMSCTHELIQYENLNIFGTQFHPEMSEDGKKLVEKFCKL